MNKTENLKLNVWEKSDPILVGDFNEDNRKIDAAVAALQGEHIYVGSYTGDGKENRTIDLPWEPTFAVVFGFVGNNSGISFITQTTHRYISSSCSESEEFATKLDGAKLVLQHSSWNNQDGKKMTYILFR